MLRLRACGVIVVLALLTGCATRGVSFDDSTPVPVQETARLIFPGGIYITEFDGVPVAWRGGFVRRGSVEIPTGERTIRGRYRSSSRSGNTVTTVQANQLSITYDFEPDRTYLLVYWRGRLEIRPR